MTPTPIVLAIGGTDPTGGAGLLADARAILAVGGRPSSVVAAVTAQNARRVSAIFEMPPEIVRAQLRAVFDAGPVAAVKTGMLASAAIVRAVAEELRVRKPPIVVVDPVMEAGAGGRLLAEEAVPVLVEELLPLADVVTPNRREAETLTGWTITDGHGQKEAARRILSIGCRAVVVKGGHFEGPESVDLLYDGRVFTEFPAPRISGVRSHGTGCAFASSLATFLALGRPLPEAAAAAKAYVAGLLLAMR